MKIKYRPEIDGLRAIAIMSVVLFHAQISKTIKGGYIGVDIFFVISGYLITSIILKEIETTNNFSFLHFIKRRIRRIIPVLFTMKLISIPLALILLPPSRIIEFSISAFYSLGFISNIYFYFSGLQYEAFEGLFVPLLHTWSLSVEEQFYIFFPIVLLIFYKFFRNYIFFLLIFLFFSSLLISEILSHSNQSLVFYFTYTRVWELILGSILSYFEYKNPNKINNKFLNLTMPTIGLIMIIFSLIFFDEKTRHPSLITLIPVIGTVLIIKYANKHDYITRLLSLKIIVFIGLISYSLYIWHFPIFSFAKIGGWASGSFLYKIYLGIATIAISSISYFILENYFRNKKTQWKHVIYFIAFTGILLIIVNFFIIKNDGYKNRFNNLKNVNPNYNLDNFYLETNRLSEEFHQKKLFEKDKTNILIIGDSHADDLRNMFFLNKEYFNSFDFISLLENQIENLKKNSLIDEAKYIMFSYRWTDELVNLVFKELIPYYLSLDKKIIITSSVNEYFAPSKMYTLLDHIILFEDREIDYYGLKNTFYENRTLHSESSINIKLKQLSKSQGLIFLNKEDYMCDLIKKECDYIDNNGFKLFYDNDHITREGAKYFGEKIYKNKWFSIK